MLYCVTVCEAIKKSATVYLAQFIFKVLSTGFLNRIARQVKYR